MQTYIEAHTLGKKLEINRYLSDLRKVRNVDSPDFIETVAKNIGLDVTISIYLSRLCSI